MGGNFEAAGDVLEENSLQVRSMPVKREGRRKETR
jgi:hypothetical protein